MAEVHDMTVRFVNRMRLISSIACLAIVVGCSSATGGTAQPTTSTDSPGSSSTSPSAKPSGSAASDVPKVSNPLPADKFYADPCAVVTPAQVAALGVNAQGKNTTTGLGPSCGWIDPNLVGGLSIGILKLNTQGLGAPYSRKSQAAYFEPLTIQGYPAVLTDRDDDRAKGQCGLHIGIADNLDVYIFTNPHREPLMSKSCEFAKQAADAMITTLKGGS
jgi:hypothetical protein